jgi:adenylate kinase family enzyme
MKRITIVGSPGAGKSTFAKALAKKTKIPLHHLDFYYHQKKFDYENDKQAWLRKLNELTSADTSIIEGNYGSSYEQRIPKSDTLIFMDMPAWLSTWSVLKRRVQYRKKRRDEMPAEWKEKIDPLFFKYVLLFRLKSRKDVVNGIEKYKHDGLEIIRFRTRRAAYRWLDEIAVYGY